MKVLNLVMNNWWTNEFNKNDRTNKVKPQSVKCCNRQRPTRNS
jgi:hypothetical protein